MDNSTLALNIFKHYMTVYPEVKHYYGIIAMYGLVTIAEQLGSESEAAELAVKVLDKFPDEIEHPQYNFPSYFVGGIAKARAVEKGLLVGEKYDAQLREYAEELMMSAQRNSQGIISHPYEGYAERIWIDVATAVTNFLLFAGLHFNEPKYIDEAVFQTLAMYDAFLDPTCGLLHQSRNFKGMGTMSEDHWSRGNGWGIFPLAELCVNLPEGHPERSRCIEYFRAHLEALLKFRTERGMWRQEITLESLDGLDSYEETSGTGLILYSIGIGINAGILERERWMPILERGISGLVECAVDEDHSILNSCPGCLCPGDGSIRAYLQRISERDEKHGAGPVVMALSAARLCTMTDIIYENKR